MARIFLSTGQTYGFIGPFSPATEVFGTTGAEKVFVEPDGKATFDPSFNRGGDEIVFEGGSVKGSSLDYLGARSGSSVVLTSQIHVGAQITIPIGSAGTKLTFSNGTFLLIVQDGAIKLGTQTITTTASRLDEVGPSMTAAAPAAALSFEETAADHSSVISSADIQPVTTTLTSVAAATGAVSEIFGASGHETIHVAGDAKVVFDPSFNRGGDEIVIAGTAEGFDAARSGSSIVLTNDAGASITIPVGSAGTTVTFDNGSFVLTVSDGAIKLGDQVITTAAAALDELGQTLDHLLAAALAPAAHDTVPALPELPLGDSTPIDQPAASSQTLLG